MNLFERELIKEKSAMGFKSLRRNKFVAEHQTGTSLKPRDRPRKALKPGKRTSFRGKDYYEYRKNRSDAEGSDI